MRTEVEIRARESAMMRRRMILLTYMDNVRESADWHGVMDASADIREVESELAALRWILEAPA